MKGIDEKLVIAINRRDFNGISDLITSGADVNAKLENNSTPLHLAAKLYQYDDEMSTEISRLLIINGANVNIINHNRYAAINIAANQGDIRLIRLLVASGADVRLAQMGGINPLHNALDANWSGVLKKPLMEIMEYLISSGAGTSNPEEMDALLNHAIEKKCSEALGIILKHFTWSDVHKYRNERFLSFAVNNNSAEAVGLLIDHGCDPNSINSNEGMTNLYRAADRGFCNVVRVLLKGGADPNKVNSEGLFEGLPPLIGAIYSDQKEIVKLLMEMGANVDFRDFRGATALHWAVEEGRCEIMQKLVKRKSLLNAPDSCGITPLHRAVIVGRNLPVEILVKAKAKLNILDNHGRTPLDYLGKNRQTISNLLKAKGGKKANDLKNNPCKE